MDTGLLWFGLHRNLQDPAANRESLKMRAEFTRPNLSSVKLLAIAAIAVAVGIAGCTKLGLDNTSRESVALNSPEITLESYRNRKISIVVPPGNLNPALSWNTLYSKMPDTTKKEFEAWANDPVGLQTEIEKRYKSAIMKIARKPEIVNEMNKAGRLYGIDPVLILGTVIGEHSFNVGYADLGQDMIASWAGRWSSRFLMNSEDLLILMRSPTYQKECQKHFSTSQAEYWDCVAWVWGKDFRGKKRAPDQGLDKDADGEFDNAGFRSKFFNPMGVGATYGLGQLDPIRALMVNDIVNETSGFPLLSIEEPEKIYAAILNPISGVHYVAANITLYLQAYLKLANFDIQNNVGVVATIYNFGKEKKFAGDRYKTNVDLLSKGKPIEPPMESYCGFFVNLKVEELQKILKMNDVQLKQFSRTGVFPF